MVEKYKIKNSTSCAKHGRLIYSDPSLIKISSSSMRAVSNQIKSNQISLIQYDKRIHINEYNK